jgi:membrane associated rhomboid family serine protease
VIVTLRRSPRATLFQWKNFESLKHSPTLRRVTEDFLAARRRKPFATYALIATNVLIFFLASRLADYDVDHYALRLRGLQQGHWWQLITFQFLHGGLLHLFLNCWGIWVFGPPVELVLGKRNFLMLYLASGVAGGLLQVGASILSAKFGGPVVGASAGLFGLIAAFTTLFPETRMTVLLFLIIPMKMTANTMLTVAAAITVVGLVVTGLWPNLEINRIAHAAHLGGLLAGLGFLRWKMRPLFVRPR